MRPILKSGLRRLRRPGALLQIGTTAGRSLLLNGDGSAEERFVLGLDGSRDTAAAVGHALRLGVSEDRAHALLNLLARSGFLDDADYDPGDLRALTPAERERLGPDLAALALNYFVPGGAVRAMVRRRDAVVAVHGCGRVGASAARLLAAAGVGCVVPIDLEAARGWDAAPGGYGSPASTGPRRQDLVRDLIHRTAPTTRTALPHNRRHPDIALLAPADGIATAAAGLHRAGVPHLLAEIRETTAVLGPLVQPGRTSCLACRDLYRPDGTPVRTGPTGDQSCDVVLATHLATLAVMHVLSHIEGDPPGSVNAELEITAPDGDRHRVPRPPHEDCDCGAATAVLRPPPAGLYRTSGAGRGAAGPGIGPRTEPGAEPADAGR